MRKKGITQNIGEKKKDKKMLLTRVIDENDE